MFEDEIKSSKNIKNIVFQYGTVKTGSLNSVFQAAQKAHVEMTKKMRQNLDKDMAVEEEEYSKAAAAKGAGRFAIGWHILGSYWLKLATESG